METAYPRWMYVTFSVALTLLTGALATSQLLNGMMVYSSPDAIRDGQYWFVFPIGAAAGVTLAIPAAIAAGILVARDVEFARTLSQALLACLVLGVGLGASLAFAGAGANGLGWAGIGFLLSLLGIAIGPLALFVISYTLPASLPVGAVLLLAVGGAYWHHRRQNR
ncbi:MAG: hypothetical protein RMK45_01935 [Armatimonadota bacterium]|nr:hypothetical protein [Armatimonadota bacterium]